MRNQIAAAKRMGVRAETINSDNQDRWEQVESAVYRNEVDPDDLDTVFQPDIPETPDRLTQRALPFDAWQDSAEPKRQPCAPVSRTADNPSLDPAEELYQTIRSVVTQLLVEPKKAAEVAGELDVTKRQAEEWLKRLVAEGVLEKRSRPVRSYVVRQDDVPAQ